MACKRGHIGIVELLLARFSQAPLTDAAIRELLQVAGASGHGHVVKKLRAYKDSLAMLAASEAASEKAMRELLAEMDVKVEQKRGKAKKKDKKKQQSEQQQAEVTAAADTAAAAASRTAQVASKEAQVVAEREARALAERRVREREEHREKERKGQETEEQRGMSWDCLLAPPSSPPDAASKQVHSLSSAEPALCSLEPGAVDEFATSPTGDVPLLVSAPVNGSGSAAPLRMASALNHFSHSMRCPISLEFMLDPVICADGHSYERANIEEWLKKSKVSPVTGLELENCEIRPNITFKITIDAYRNRTRGKAESAINNN